jgi:hypothetical protein
MMSGVQFHPSSPFFATSSGQRIFNFEEEENNLENDFPKISLWGMNYEVFQNETLSQTFESEGISEENESLNRTYESEREFEINLVSTEINDFNKL